MRIFWRFITLLLILTGLIFSWPYIESSFLFDDQNKNNALNRVGAPKNSKVILTYPLADKDWLVFELASSDQRLKVITNAELPLDYQASIGERWLYAIEYQLLDASDTVLQQADIYHKTSQHIFLDETTQQNYVSAVYYPAFVKPVDARLHLLNLRGETEAVRIRLRLKSLTLPLVGVVARVYRQQPMSTSLASAQWQRLSEDKKNKLARASVYQQDLLRESEKQKLVASQWSPIGPAGVIDEDYATQKLYVVREVEEDSIVNLAPIPPQGLIVYPNQYGVIKVPVFAGEVKLTWQTLVPLTFNDEVKIEWWGHPSSRYQQWNLSALSQEFNQQLDSGVLQLSTSKPMVFRVWIDAEKEAVEITPKRSNLRLYHSDGRSVSYQINHLDDKNTAFRVDLRGYIDLGEQTIQYRFYDQNEAMIKQGQLKLLNLRSNYDRFNSTDASNISDPSRYYFSLPESVKRLELIADHSVWLAAYTRPNNLGLLTHYPYKQDNATNTLRNQPAWYFMRPSHWKQYVASGRSLLLSTQSRPPEIDQLLLDGLYQWQSFLPEGNWRGRQLLAPLEGSQNQPNQNTQNRFMPLFDQLDQVPVNKAALVIEFKGGVGEKLVTPELIFTQDKQSKLKINLWLDNQLYLEKVVYAKDGVLNLEPVAVGKHKLKVEVEVEDETKVKVENRVQLLINRVAGVTQGYSKRMAVQLHHKKINFNYLKQSDQELLAIRIYTAKENKQKQNVRIKINGLNQRKIGPFESWTITERAYVLEPTDGADARLLNAKNRQLGPARLLFIKLSEDMPNNREYQISIQLEATADAYLVMSKTTPGVFKSSQLKAKVEG